jgi:hypothetical protein
VDEDPTGVAACLADRIHADVLVAAAQPGSPE